jgi:hypothetical protein
MQRDRHFRFQCTPGNSVTSVFSEFKEKGKGFGDIVSARGNGSITEFDLLGGAPSPLGAELAPSISKEILSKSSSWDSMICLILQSYPSLDCLDKKTFKGIAKRITFGRRRSKAFFRHVSACGQTKLHQEGFERIHH